MDVKRFVAEVKRDYSEWEEAIRFVPPDRLREPGVSGVWSVVDIVAHISWYEREMNGLLALHELAGSPWWELPLDQQNERIYEENRGRPAGEVLKEVRSIHEELIGRLRSMKDEDLTDPARFNGMPSDWSPADVIAGSTYKHYRAHAAAVRRWLSAGQSSSGQQ